MSSILYVFVVYTFTLCLVCLCLLFYSFPLCLCLCLSLLSFFSIFICLRLILSCIYLLSSLSVSLILFVTFLSPCLSLSGVSVSLYSLLVFTHCLSYLYVCFYQSLLKEFESGVAKLLDSTRGCLMRGSQKLESFGSLKWVLHNLSAHFWWIWAQIN